MVIGKRNCQKRVRYLFAGKPYCAQHITNAKAQHYDQLVKDGHISRLTKIYMGKRGAA